MPVSINNLTIQSTITNDEPSKEEKAEKAVAQNDGGGCVDEEALRRDILAECKRMIVKFREQERSR